MTCTGDIVRLQIGQMTQRMSIVNADTNRLLRINSNCLVPVYIYASRPDEDTCDVHEDNFVGQFNGGIGEYNTFISFVGQIFMFQMTTTNQILPSYIIKDKKQRKDITELHEHTVECNSNADTTIILSEHHYDDHSA